MEKKKIGGLDLESTNYNPDQVENLDYRLEEGRKNFMFLHGLGLGATILALVWVYFTGNGDPKEMTYLFGMPIWISGAIIIFLAMFIIGSIYVSKWEEFPLTARYKKEDK